MKNYLIDSPQEKDRLNYQNKIDVYSLGQELRFIYPEKGLHYLDAGCGNGNVIEALLQLGVNKIHGIDLSSDRITEAKKRFKDFSDVTFFERSLDHTELPDSTYDRVICRYIFEHVTNVKEILWELQRVLKPHGKMHIINLDDVFFGFHTKNERFNNELKNLKANLPQDFEIGRKLPQMLSALGMKDIQWEAQTYFFQNERMEMEIENARMRLEQARAHLSSYFTSLLAYDQFAEMYLEEMHDPNNVMWTTKYMITATRPIDGKVIKLKP